MRVEHHLLGFPGISHDEHLSAEGQAEMREFDGLNDAAELDLLVAPVELADLPGAKANGTKAWVSVGRDLLAFQRRTKRCTLS